MTNLLSSTKFLQVEAIILIFHQIFHQILTIYSHYSTPPRSLRIEAIILIFFFKSITSLRFSIHFSTTTTIHESSLHPFDRKLKIPHSSSFSRRKTWKLSLRFDQRYPLTPLPNLQNLQASRFVSISKNRKKKSQNSSTHSSNRSFPDDFIPDHRENRSRLRGQRERKRRRGELRAHSEQAEGVEADCKTPTPCRYRCKLFLASRAHRSVTFATDSTPLTSGCRVQTQPRSPNFDRFKRPRADRADRSAPLSSSSSSSSSESSSRRSMIHLSDSPIARPARFLRRCKRFERV